MRKKEIQFSPKLIGDLLDIIHNAILITDFQNRIIFANNRTARMFRTPAGNLQGLEITKLFMPDDRETMVPNIVKITRDTGEFDGEVMLQRPDGSSFLGMLAATFFLWDNKEAGMAFTIHDISDIKALEQSLIRSERIAFLGHLVDDISHQIRNPVTIIGGFSRRISSECQGSEEAKVIIKEANYLETLLNTLNSFIRLPPPNLRRITMAELLDSMDKKFYGKVSSLGCRWQCIYQSDIREQTLLVDLDLLLEALEAILVNACESYAPATADKPVTCTVTLADDLPHPCTISITDQGIGIPEDHLSLAFSHFYSSKTKHIGMGLTFALRILEEQMGRITIASAKGKGTTVSCHLIKERRRAIRTTRLT